MEKISSILSHNKKRGLGLLLLLFVPLIFSTSTGELFEFPKMFFVYILGSLVLFISLGKIWKTKEFVFPNVWVLVFYLCTLVSIILSDYKYNSLWGYYPRLNGGFVSTTVYFFLYVLVLNLAKTEEGKEKLLKNITGVSIFVVVPISAFAISQHWEGIERVFSTLGQANWLAAYLAMITPLVLHKIKTGRIKLFYVAVFVAVFSAVWFTYSVSGIGAMFIGILIFIVLYGLSKHVVLALAFSCLVAVFNLGFFQMRIEDVFRDLTPKNAEETIVDENSGVTENLNSTIEPVQVETNTNEYNLSDTGSIRKNLWKGSIEIFKANPKFLLFGSGPETFTYEFQKQRPKEVNYTSEWDFILNKPHNYYLEIGLETGLVSLVAYLMVFVGVFKKKNKLVIPVFVAYLGANAFSWPSVSSELLFWMLLGTTENGYKTKLPLLEKFGEKVPKVVFRLVPFLAIFPIYLFVNLYRAEILNKKAKSLLAQHKYEIALEKADLAIEKNPNEPSYFRNRARIYISKSFEDENTYEQFKKVALSDIKTAEELNKNNMTTLRNAVPLYYYLALGDLDKNTDPKYLLVSQNYYERMKTEYPTDAGMITSVAKYEKRLGLDEGYNFSKDLVRELRPDLLEWHTTFIE